MSQPQYRTVDMGAVMQDYERTQTDKAIFKPGDAGNKYLRILPPRADAKVGLYFVPFWIHWGLDKLNPVGFGDVRHTVCRAKTYREACPVCDIHNALRARVFGTGAQPTEEEKDLEYDIRPKERFAMNIVNMDKPEDGVMIWSVPKKPTMNAIRGVFNEWGDVCHPETGRVLKVTFEKGKFGVVCESVQATPKSDPIVVPNWWEHMHDLDAFVSGMAMPLDELRERLMRGREPETTHPAPAAAAPPPAAAPTTPPASVAVAPPPTDAASPPHTDDDAFDPNDPTVTELCKKLGITPDTLRASMGKAS